MAGISQSILSDYESISKNEAFCALTNAMPDMVLLTNSQRKVVYVNKTVKEFSGFGSTTGFLGKHPGEIISCINQISLFDVCGFHQNCSGCEFKLPVDQQVPRKRSPNARKQDYFIGGWGGKAI